MKERILLTTSLLALATGIGFSQVPNQGLALKIADAQRANGAKLKNYSWSSRVELLESATVQDIRISSVSYGPDNQLQRTVLNDQPSPLPHGFLRKRIAEKKRAEVEKYLLGLNKVLDQYTLPTAGKVLDFVSKATVSAPDANGLLQLNGNDVVMPGDTLTLWVDAKTRQASKIQVSTTFQGDFIQASASFRTIPNGPTHLEFATAAVAAKNLTLQAHNYNYNANN
jgi:hypothetical protein